MRSAPKKQKKTAEQTIKAEWSSYNHLLFFFILPYFAPNVKIISLTIPKKSVIIAPDCSLTMKGFRGVAHPVERLVWERAGGGDAPAGKNALRAKSKATKSLAIIEKTPL